MKSTLQPVRNSLAFQQNNLVRAPLRMPILAQRIFFQALSHINAKTTNFQLSEIPVDKVMRGLTNGESYGDVHDAVRHLLYRVLNLVPVNKRSTETHGVPLMARCQFSTSEGIIRVKFNEEAAPYLLQLKGEYTVTEIEPLLRFKNPNSPRLYNILHSFNAKGEGDFHKETVSLDDLKLWLLENVELYPIFTEFKRRVLDPIAVEFAAVGYNATWEPSKTGKKTTGITFTIPRKMHKLVPTEATKESVDQSVAQPPAAPVMRVNKDEPATLNQVVQVAAARLAGSATQPAPAQDMKSKVSERLNKLRLTPAQIKKVLEIVTDEAELTRLFLSVYPLLKNMMQGVKEHGPDEVGRLTVNRLKTDFPRINAVWSKE